MHFKTEDQEAATYRTVDGLPSFTAFIIEWSCLRRLIQAKMTRVEIGTSATILHPEHPPIVLFVTYAPVPRFSCMLIRRLSIRCRLCSLLRGFLQFLLEFRNLK